MELSIEALQEELRKKEVQQLNTLDEVLDEVNGILEKAQFMINKITDDYCFFKAPNHDTIRETVHNWR